VVRGREMIDRMAMKVARMRLMACMLIIVVGMGLCCLCYLEVWKDGKCCEVLRSVVDEV
jgi:hypothetical protein